MKSNITNINVHVLNYSVGVKAFEFLNSMLQSKEPEFKQTVSVTVSEKKLKKNNDTTVDILFVSMPKKLTVNVDDYDLVVFSNADEPLQVASDIIIKNIHKKNCYLISNSLLTKNHALYDSVIHSSHDLLICHQYWTNPVYPQYYSLPELSKNNCRDKDLFFINGANRSWRHHFLTLLDKEKITFPLKSSISAESIIHETNDAPWETTEDAEFRMTLNDMYPITRNTPTSYYDDSIQVGICTGFELEGLDNKTTKMPPGYFILPEYYQYKCIIFPETAWQNNELSITEKSLKCFYAESIPWPVGGANINRLYNQIGFKTAWNLLPENLKDYDQELDHFKRYEKHVTAIKWMQHNLNVLSSPAAETIRKENKQKFLDNNISQMTAEQLWDAIKNNTKNKL